MARLGQLFVLTCVLSAAAWLWMHAQVWREGANYSDIKVNQRIPGPAPSAMTTSTTNWPSDSITTAPPTVSTLPAKKTSKTLSTSSKAILTTKHRAVEHDNACTPSAWQQRCQVPPDEIVFALMVTGKDRAHIPLSHIAMRSFAEQTYPSKVMIIVNDGDVSVKAYSAYANHSCICEKMVKRRPDLKLGALRNMAMRLVPQGGVWVQWDDDDYRNRTCMAGQVAAMRNGSADFVFLQRQIHIDLLWNSTFKYEYGDWGIWGTLMVNTSHPAVRSLQLPNIDRGEDLYYDDLRAKARSLVWSNEPHMYFRVIHGRNTWERAHFRPEIRFKRDTWCLRMETQCTAAVVRDTHEMFALYRAATNWTDPG